jgi:uncharacterized membrane protein YhaH (DUF805 family)
MEWMILPLRRYADFQGRSRRMEYWMFFLFTILVNIGFAILLLLVGGGAAAFGAVDQDNPAGILALGGAVGVIYIINILFSLAILIPSIAVGVRRLHDTNRTGWWLLMPVVPYLLGIVLVVAGLAALGGGVGGGVSGGFGTFAILGGVMVLAALAVGIALLVFLLLPGTTGPNRFGPDPKNPEANLGDVFS